MLGTFDARRTRAMVQALALPGNMHAYAEVKRKGTRIAWTVTDASGRPVASGMDRVAPPMDEELAG